MDFLTDEEKAKLKEEDNKASNEVFVKNLDFRVTTYDLKRYCETSFGPVEQCIVKTHTKGKHRGKSKGTDMAIASQHGTLQLRGRILTVRSLPYKDAELYYSKRTQVFSLEDFRMGSWDTKGHFMYIRQPGRCVSCRFSTNKRKIVITCNEYTLVISFKDLCDSLVLERRDSKVIVYLSLKRPPRIFGKEKHPLGYNIFEMFLSAYQEEEEDVRLCDFTQDQIMKHCPVYQLTFSNDIPSLLLILLDLARFNLTDEPLKFVSPCVRVSVYDFAQPDLDYFLHDVPFHIRFKVESLINSWKILDPRIHAPQAEFQRFIKLIMDNADNNVLEGALESMAYAESSVIFDLVHTLQSFLQISRPITVGKDFMLVSRVLITPTKIHLVGPEIEVSNRVLRQYQRYSSHFIRVSFVDEDLCQLLGNQFSNSFADRFKAILGQGLKIAGRRFEFLAYSSSQLREHGCWFFSSVDMITPDSIRRWMGDFTGNKIVAKYAARMGQCFSTTFVTAEVRPLDIKRIPDIRTNDEVWVFSDGIGQISSKFAEAISATLGYSKVPSAFQCRIGGCKGMVAVDPRARHQLYIRPSMEKFTSSHSVFEVIGRSHFMASYLNRQIIILLSNLGIRNEAFETLQDEMVLLLNAALKNNDAAKTMLRSMPDQHDFSSTVVKMLKGGFSVRNEPFLYCLVKAMYLKKMKDLKQKTRILLKESACLIGTLDETKSLEYGQVFLQIIRPGTKGPQVITGRVFVVKNPAFHPGDIRVLQAVDCASLHHTVDCLVFPAVGPRPHTSETSGSDLDGDIYTVCWDQSLVPSYHLPPGMYESPTPVTKDHIEMPDIHNFFIEYMGNANLGIIANTHMAIADSSPDGPNDRRCLRLTELHSTAVDYPKTGVPARLDPDLRVDLKVGYPDFMEKKGKPQYNSPRILGILYRKIHPTQLPIVPLTFDSDLVVDGYEEYTEEALNSKKDYNFRTIALMNQFGVKTEAELVSGCVVKVGRQFLKKKFFDHIQRMCHAVHAMKKEAQFEEELGEMPQDEWEHHRRAKASAWYVVTYAEEFRAKQPGARAKELLGFPWIMVDLLVKIKKEKEELQAK